jgi:hypothetical protein
LGDRDFGGAILEDLHDLGVGEARVEKVLEDAQIKLSSMATDVFGMSGRATLEAMIAGQRDPRVRGDGPHAAAISRLIAFGHSILVIVWHLINDPAARFHDLRADHHQRLADPARKTRDLVRQLQALGHDIASRSATPTGKSPPSSIWIRRAFVEDRCSVASPASIR